MKNDSYLSPKSIWTLKSLTWNWFTGFSQHLEGRKTHEHDVVRERERERYESKELLTCVG